MKGLLPEMTEAQLVEANKLTVSLLPFYTEENIIRKIMLTGSQNRRKSLMNNCPILDETVQVYINGAARKNIMLPISKPNISPE